MNRGIVLTGSHNIEYRVSKISVHDRKRKRSEKAGVNHVRIFLKHH